MPNETHYYRIPILGGPMDGGAHATKHSPPPPLLYATHDPNQKSYLYILFSRVRLESKGMRIGYFYARPQGDQPVWNIPLRGGPSNGRKERSNDSVPPPIVYHNHSKTGPPDVYHLYEERVQTSDGWRFNYEYRWVQMKG